jgi:hypothetical protein
LHAEHALKCLKVEYLGRIEYDFQKSRGTGPWDHMVSVSAKKEKKKISCLCTFKAKMSKFQSTKFHVPFFCDIACTSLHEAGNITKPQS